MTLDWPWPILRQGQIWSHRLLYGKKWKLLFFGNHCSLGSQNCLKHLAKWVNEVGLVSKVKVIIWPWSKVTQISKLKLVFLKNFMAIWKQSSYDSLREKRNENLYKWVGHMTNMAAMPISGINLKKSSSPEPIDWWHWNLVCYIVYASITKVVQIMTWVDLDPCYAKVKFGHIGFCMGKSENYYFLETITALDIKVAWSIQLNELINLSEYLRSRPFFDLGRRSLRFQVKTCFSHKQLGNLEPKLI